MNKKHFKVLIILVFSALISVSGHYIAEATISFSSSFNLSNSSSENSVFPVIAANNNNVYVAWQENLATGEVYFNASSTRGTSFISSAAINLSNSASHDSEDIDIDVYQNNVYIVWHNNTSTANEEKIQFIRSTNNGTSFESVLDISGDQTFVDEPRLAVSGESVYVLWEQDSTGDIQVDARPTNGTTSLGIENVSSDGTDSSQAEIIANSTNVFVVWKDEQGSDEIRFSRSTDSGDNFSASTNISSDSHDSLEPEIAVGGSNVYVAWRNNTTTDNIGFAVSTNSGSSFGTAKNIGTSTGTIRTDSVQIAASGSNVYVTWADSTSNDDVFIVTSNDGGTTFSSPVNLSDNTGNSVAPSIAVSGSNVYVAWQDSTVTGSTTTDEILMKFSTNNGQNFCGSSTNVSNDAGRDSEKVQVEALSDKVYLVWEDGPNGGQETLFKVADTPTPDCTSFDESQYTLNETATITVTDATESGSINVTVTSDSDSTGITVSLSETGSGTGTFTGQITFTTGSSSGSALKAKAGDTITATFGSSVGTASIHAISIAFSPSAPTLNNIVSVTVTDLNSNQTTSVETIDITVTSSVDSSGTSLRLTETGGKTGVFTQSGALILMSGNDEFTVDQEINLQLTESGTNVQNADTGAIDKITMTLTSETDPTGIDVILTETGVNTGIFKNSTTFSSTGPSGTTTLHAPASDFIAVSFLGESSRGLIIPNTNSSRGAVEVTIGGTVTATHLAASNSFTVATGSGGGGGGGGLVRPTVVLNAVLGAAAVFGGGSSGDSSPPIATLDKITKSKHISVPDHIREIVENQKPNVPIKPLENEPYDLPLAINEKKYPLGNDENTIETNNISVGEPIKFQMMFYEQRDLEHVSIYMNLRDGKKSHESDTYVEFNLRQEGLKIIDKNGFFENVDFEVIEGEDNKKFAVFDITFAKAMETSDLVYKSWDFDRRGTAVKVNDAIKVGEIPSEEPTDKTSEDLTEIATKEKPPVPNWVKSNAKWWADGGIDDQTFTNGIGFLISEKIIDVPVEANVSKEKDENGEIIEEESEEPKIPQWVKTNAKWWADELLDEETFLSGIEYLVKREIIIVS